MRTLHLAVGISTSLVVSAIAGIALSAGFAMAQSDVSSRTSPLLADVATTADSSASGTTPPPEQAPTSEQATELAAPMPLAAAKVIGAKYVDYCTDGTKVTAYPGDPAIDANLNKPDAPTPKCPDGMTWDHTSGMDEYDTPSGELDVGTYAQQLDGTYIVHYAAGTYKDASSTSQWPDRIVISGIDPTQAVSAQQPPQDGAPTSADAQAASSTQ